MFTISSQEDPTIEVAVVGLEEGGAVMCHPHAVAAVVHPVEQRVKITSHWRLFQLHSWITLQFRYLVFHGPCQIVVRGGRGVKTETVEPGPGRMINQPATIGFTAHSRYRSTRCETFWSYFRGKEALFNDRFEGDGGSYFYEQIPLAEKRRGLGGKLEGLLDGVLKVFGV